MTQPQICCAGKTPALSFAKACLERQGHSVSAVPDWDTHHLLLDVPSFRPGLWSQDELDTLLSSLHPDTILWGGNLKDSIPSTVHTVDLLKNEAYLVQNAAITADCTIPIIHTRLTHSWQESPALIIGWGRIGKALAARLHQRGCTVTVASTRNESQAEIEQEGFRYIPLRLISSLLPSFRVIVNTAPAPVLDEASLSGCTACVKIDLASIKGMAGDDVIWARALPGRFAPEASGQLIAETFLRLWKEETQ